MPPRVVNVAQAGGGVQDWYGSIPPITRFCATACFLTAACAYVRLLHPSALALLPDLLFRRFQLWRLLTPHFFLGGFSVPFVFQMIWLLQYGKILESQTYMFNPADMVFMLLVCAAAITSVALALPSLSIYFTGPSLVFVLIYLYSKNFPDQQVSIMGLFTVQSFYLPFVFMGMTVVYGQSLLPDVLGIAAGHLYWFLAELYPAQGGPQLLRTPEALKQLCANWGLGQAAPAASGRGAPAAAPTGFAAFRGQGRRLVD